MSRFEVRPASLVAGVVGSGPFSTSGEWTSEVWESARAVFPGHEGPWITANHPRQTEFTMYVGVETIDTLPTPVTIELVSQEYAVTRVRGDQRAIVAAYDELHRWIASHGRAVNLGALQLELYATSPYPRPDEFEFDLWLPLVSNNTKAYE